jgi:hypothetical protein
MGGSGKKSCQLSAVSFEQTKVKREERKNLAGDDWPR